MNQFSRIILNLCPAYTLQNEVVMFLGIRKLPVCEPL